MDLAQCGFSGSLLSQIWQNLKTLEATLETWTSEWPPESKESMSRFWLKKMEVLLLEPPEVIPRSMEATCKTLVDFRAQWPWNLSLLTPHMQNLISTEVLGMALPQILRIHLNMTLQREGKRRARLFLPVATCLLWHKMSPESYFPQWTTNCLKEDHRQERKTYFNHRCLIPAVPDNA